MEHEIKGLGLTLDKRPERHICQRVYGDAVLFIGGSAGRSTSSSKARDLEMHEVQAIATSPDAEAIDCMAASMIERFGDRAAGLAAEQIAAVHAARDGLADHWLSIFLSIEDRLGRTRPIPLPGAVEASAAIL